MNYSEILRNHARNRPAHPAILDSISGVTYAQLDRLVDAAAARMAAHGVRQGDMVALAAADERIEYMIAFYGLMRVGATVACPAADNPDELRSELAQFEARWLVGDALHDMGNEVGVIGVDDSWRKVEGPVAPFDMPHGEDMPAYLVQTSGTTSGKPRAVLFTHGDLMRRVNFSQMNLGYGPWDRFASLVPMSFNVGRLHMMQTLQTGGTGLVLPRSVPPPAIPSLIATNAITWMFVTPFHLRKMLREFANAERPVLQGLRQLVVASSALTAQERAAARRVLLPQLVEQYGTAQGGLHSVSFPADQDAAPDAVGRVAIGAEAEIVDKTDQPVSAGTIGEIRLRGVGCATGYYKDPEATARSFRDGWFYPGDLALVDARGYLHLKGRVDDMFIFDGVNIYPDEIEAVLMRHPQVVEAAVVGQPSEDNQDVPVAFVVVNGAVTERALFEYFSTRLSMFRQPRLYYFVQSLPKNDIGKVVRARLRRGLPVLPMLKPRPQ
jgi:acyl-CoA synthetase (AMP-forming)/AMP-acid ligase II